MSLPSTIIIKFGKFVWTTMWHQMMSQLAPRNESGAYIRPESQFRHDIDDQPENPYKPESGRYALYVGIGCPWAHRTLVVRALKGLESVISVVWVRGEATEGGWMLETPEEGCQSLKDVYQLSQPGYQGRATVPVLWDTQTQTVVNNESADIIEILNREFNEWADHTELDLYPTSQKEEIDSLNDRIYHTVNNGVYRCGFAQTQSAYEQACNELFLTLDDLEKILTNHRYLCGENITLADVRLFTTLFRFDAVYYGLFKCNKRRIRDYKNLYGYLQDIYQLPGVSSTCDLEKVKQDYYSNLFPLNPGGIIPSGPDQQDLLSPHNREKIKLSAVKE